MLRDFPQYSRSIRTLNKRMRYFGSRKIAPPPPSPNSNTNPKPNPAADRGAVFLGDNFPDSRYFNIPQQERFFKCCEGSCQKELNGPGNLLGYRAMHLKIRLKKELNVTRD